MLMHLQLLYLLHSSKTREKNFTDFVKIQINASKTLIKQKTNL